MGPLNMILPKTAALWADAAVFPEAWMPFGSTAPWVHVPVRTSAVYVCLGQEVTSSFCASMPSSGNGGGDSSAHGVLCGSGEVQACGAQATV